MKTITAITVVVSGLWRISERMRISYDVYRLFQQTASYYYSGQNLWYTLEIEHMHFTPIQIGRFANIFDNAGQVFLAVMVLTPIVQGIDKTNSLVVVLGILDILLCWTVSIILVKRKER
jgi:small-conductance mechanosensitive channel